MVVRMSDRRPRVMTLTEFLLARIAEDETAAQDAGSDAWTTCPFDGKPQPWESPEDRQFHFDTPSHADECGVQDSQGDVVVYDEGRPTGEQARHIARHDPARILRECKAKRRLVGDEWSEDPETLGILASVYADHPDYRQEWNGLA